MEGEERQSRFGFALIGTGFAAGLLATLPMMILMVVSHRFLRARERYPLPPHIIMSRLLGGRWGIATSTGKGGAAELSVLTMTSHFSYGGACGSVFALVERAVPLPGPVKAIVFGLGVWAASYLAWLPAFGILEPATEAPPRRNAVMIAAHIVWGAAAGMLLDLFEPGDATGDTGAL